MGAVESANRESGASLPPCGGGGGMENENKQGACEESVEGTYGMDAYSEWSM